MFPRLMLRLAVAGIFAVALAIFAGFLWLHSELEKPLHIPEDGYLLDIESGESLSVLARSLADKEILKNPYALLIHARLTDRQSIQQGEYLLHPGDTPKTLLEKLIAGAVVSYTVTFPEGWTLAQWLAVLAAQEPLEKLSEEEINGYITEFHDAHGTAPEGWFFPDTYTYVSGDSPLEILERARVRMQQVLQDEWQDRAPGLPYETAYEALIMASIIEKETAVVDERDQIAGVFVRRLQLGMRLQTDPTVIYGLGDQYQGNLTKAHLRQDGPYNTYRIKGLPPTPIANPGRAAINAALHPGLGDHLYFVARGDGTHQFSATLEQHQQAVKEYQLRRRSGYRSTPAP